MPRRIALIPVLFLSGLSFAEPGPPPREARFDKNGFLLPAGAIARLGIPTPLRGFPWSLAWTADGTGFVVVETGFVGGEQSRVTRFDAVTGGSIETHTFAAEYLSLYAPLSPDGRRTIVLSGSIGTVYETATAATRRFNLPPEFANPNRKVYSLSLSDDCRFLVGIAAPASRPGVAWRYDLARDKFIHLMKDRSDLTSVKISPDGKRVYATGGALGDELTAHDLRTGRELWTVNFKSAGNVRAVSADGRRLAVSHSGGLTIYDAAGGQVVLSATINSATPPSLWGIDLSRDGSQVAMCDYRDVVVWDVRSGKVRHRLAQRARQVAFSPDGKSLVTAGDWVQRWNLETGKPVYPEPILDKPVGATILKWSADGGRLLTVWPGEGVSASRPFRSDQLAVWDTARMTTVSRWRTDEAVLACTIDGPTVRCYLDRKLLRTWDVEHPDRETVALLHVPRVELQQSAYAFLTDGRFAMQWHDGEGMTLHVYDRSGGLELRRLQAWATGMYGRPAASYQRQGTTAFGPDGWRFDLAENRAQPPLEGRISFHLSNLLAVESRTFIAGRTNDLQDTRGHLWESVTGRIIADLPRRVPNLDRAVLSPDGRFLASSTDDQVIVHDFKDPAGNFRLSAPGTSALAFSPDGSWLATASADGTVLVWTVPRQVLPWQPADADRLWNELLVNDAARAWLAIWHLLDHPAKATELIAARLTPISAWDDTAEQIARLDHPKYPVRERATRELAVRGRGVEEALRAVLKAPRSEEQRTRAEQLLGKIDTAVAPTGEMLRGLRCVWLLERIGTPQAKKLLSEVANGMGWSLATIEAKAALERLK